MASQTKMKLFEHFIRNVERKLDTEKLIWCGSMLYVFFVGTGTQLKLEMTRAMETVAQLKETIERIYGIPAEKQVLLVSGGECLDMSARVFSYSAGTDSNPLFLFAKMSIDNPWMPPTIKHDYEFDDSDVTEKVEASLHMPPTHNTVVVRTSLAQRLEEIGREYHDQCQQLVHEQHLQQQGWAAALANLDDSTKDFEDRGNGFLKDYQKHLDAREENLENIKTFDSDMQTLSLIPILPELLKQERNRSVSSDVAGDAQAQTMTLFDWISAKDNSSSLQAAAEQCRMFLTQLDENVLDGLSKEVADTIGVATKEEMKEIEGVGNWFSSLDELMEEAKKKVALQKELSDGFQKNKIRSDEEKKEVSHLPFLCEGHSNQLLMMLENHTKLKDIHSRCLGGKHEFSKNLQERLSWVAYAQNMLLKVGNKIVLYQDSLKRIRKHTIVVQQIQRAPEMYCLAVGEVVRRKKFSNAFQGWATDISQKWLAAYNEESERRRDFMMQFSGHFLTTLFPGLEDEPPTFASQPPDPFDMQLPNLSDDDLILLKSIIPNLALDTSWTDLSNVAQMLLSHGRNDVSDGGSSSKEDQLACKKQELERLTGTLAAATVALRVELAEVRELTANELDSFNNLVRSIQNHVSQVTEGYVEQLNALQTEKRTCVERIALLEQENNDSREETERLLAQKDEEMKLKYNEIKDRMLKSEIELSERAKAAEQEAINARESNEVRVKTLEEAVSQTKQAAHDAQAHYDQMLSDERSKLAQIEEELAAVKARFQEEKDELQLKLVKTELCAELEAEKRAKEVEAEHLKAITELEAKHARDKEVESERLAVEYKTELSGLRSRFRLMSITSMEKSPSDLSLEKIERSDVIELVNHEAILEQTKEDAELEKERAVAEAVAAERERCKQKLEEEIRAARSRMEVEKQVWLKEAVTRATAEQQRKAEDDLRSKEAESQSLSKVLEDKDRQLDLLLAKHQSLSTECQRHRDTIRRLTDGEHIRSGAGTLDPLLQRVDELEKEKKELQQALDSFGTMQQSVSNISSPSKTDEMAASVSVLGQGSSKDPDPTVPIPAHFRSGRGLMYKSMREGKDKISVTTCNTGDSVLVLWNVEHSNYLILQESSTLHFLNGDCFDVLGLRPASDGSPKRLYALATVISKEYCHAKKSENRYKVPKGTKFYRVVVKPLVRDRHDTSLTRSQTTADPVELS